MYTHGSFLLRFNRKQQNSIKQLSFNLKINLKDKIKKKEKESACNVVDLGSIPRLGRSPGEGKGYPLQYSGLENSINCIVHGVTRVGH